MSASASAFADSTGIAARDAIVEFILNKATEVEERTEDPIELAVAAALYKLAREVAAL